MGGLFSAKLMQLKKFGLSRSLDFANGEIFNFQDILLPSLLPTSFLGNFILLYLSA